MRDPVSNGVRLQNQDTTRDHKLWKVLPPRLMTYQMSEKQEIQQMLEDFEKKIEDSHLAFENED